MSFYNKVRKASASIIDCYLTYIIKVVKLINIPKVQKQLQLVQYIEKMLGLDKKKYRLVSLLNGFSKVYKRFLQNSLSKFTDQIFSKFVSAYQKS